VTSTQATLVERARRAGFAPGLVAGWQAVGSAEPTILRTGRVTVEPGSVPVDETTWFDLASLTKPLAVGTLILLAARRGWLDLETTVGEVLAEARTTRTARITVRELLIHRSGLPAWAPVYALAEGRRDAAVDAVLALPITPAPRDVVYSCPGFLLLGWMLERRADTALDDLFRELVVVPLELDDDVGFRPACDRTLAGGAAEPRAERSLCEERGLDPGWIPKPAIGLPDDGNARFLGGVAGNAGLFGTVIGVLRIARAFLEAGEFLTAEEIDLATTDHTPGLSQARGLGWQLAASPGCSAGSALHPGGFGHTGFTGTSLWIDPTRGIAIALLANRTHPAHRDVDLHPLRRRFHHLVVDSLG
jgi:CubicO group peptidase (beta-lactamase class C family)